MDNNKVLIISIISIIVGILGGWLIWGGHSADMSGAHTMTPGSMTSNLQGKTGDDFDKEFLAEMIVHHEGAVTMAHQVLATSKRPELLKLAEDIITAQEKEIAQMKNWQQEWFTN